MCRSFAIPGLHSYGVERIGMYNIGTLSCYHVAGEPRDEHDAAIISTKLCKSKVADADDRAVYAGQRIAP